MKTLVGIPFDASKHVAIAVPKHFTIDNSGADVLVVEGKMPDSTWQVDRRVKITFFLEPGGTLARICKKNEQYTSGPTRHCPGKKHTHGSRCVTHWVLAWLANGIGR